jgi:hypothetical protein
MAKTGSSITALGMALPGGGSAWQHQRRLSGSAQ